MMMSDMISIDSINMGSIKTDIMICHTIKIDS